jgi:hypothetical protein
MNNTLILENEKLIQENYSQILEIQKLNEIIKQLQGMHNSVCNPADFVRLGKQKINIIESDSEDEFDENELLKQWNTKA